VHDEPVAVELPKARREADPSVVAPPILHRSPDSIEAVRECHVIADRDREVANLVVERTLKHREEHCPVFPFCLGSRMT
jgi:hypothetical protein